MTVIEFVELSNCTSMLFAWQADFVLALKVVVLWFTFPPSPDHNGLVIDIAIFLQNIVVIELDEG